MLLLELSEISLTKDKRLTLYTTFSPFHLHSPLSPKTADRKLCLLSLLFSYRGVIFKHIVGFQFALHWPMGGCLGGIEAGA